MKKTIFTIALMSFSLLAISQDGAIAKYFQSYQDSEEFTKINISSKMFELFTHIDAESQEDQEVLETISDIIGMKMIINDHPDNGAQMYRDACKMPGLEYEILMTVDDKDEDLTFFIKEENGIINELLLIGGGETNFFVMSLLGDIDLHQISKLSRNVSINGMEHLEHIDK